MPVVLYCLVYEHDLRIVALAAILCFFSASVAMLLLRRGQDCAGPARLIWLASAGGASGFGIWTTHFVAMLAYDTTATFAYEIWQTLLSLAVAIATTTTASLCAVYARGHAGSLAAGLLFGVGVSSMHFIGMAAVEFSGMIVWDRWLVVMATVLAVIFSVAAFGIRSRRRRESTSTLPAAALLSLGIVLMHFTAMSAITVVEYGGPTSADLLSSGLIILIISSVAVSLLFSGLVAALFALKAEHATVAGEASFRLLVQGVTDYAIYMLDTEGRVSNWNAGAERAKGYTAQEIVGQHFSKFYSLEDQRNGVPEAALSTARTMGKFEAEGLRYRKNGSSFWASVVIDPIYNEDGTLVGYAKITRDCTQQMLAARRLKETSDNLSLALDNMANGICLLDQDERLVLHNRRLNEIIGISSSVSLVGQTLGSLEELHSSPKVQDHNAEGPFNSDRRISSPRDSDITICAIRNGKTVCITRRPTGDGSSVMTIEDISKRVESEAQIAHLARHDMLTGLPNRRQFDNVLDTAINHADGHATKVAVIAIDLDNFKEINDTLGHAAGDAVLAKLAYRMLDTLVAGEAVARLGGDEFAAAKSYSSQTQLDDFIRRMSQLLTTKIELPQTDVIPGASMGIAIYPKDGTDREKLLSNADMAMYRAKASIDHQVSYYEPAMDDAARERRAIGREIWVALEQEQFFLTYQVQQSLATKVTTGYEVLLRWLHPERGLISPADFIPIAEECGAIIAIGDWVLEKACRDAVELPLQHKIAVNLSPLQLNNAILVEKVRDILIRTGLPPSQLELEVTESAIIGDKARALHILRQLKDMGITIAIDDFGTGYSSLETLRSFPFDKIKLDRSFVQDLESRQSKAFVRAIVALGKSLDVAILAEGVETSEQLEVILAEGCDEVQGFLFGRPSTLEQLATRDADQARKVG